MSPYRALAGLLLIIALSLADAGSAAAITSDEFLLRSGADVVALCATPASDPLYTAAVHMCHGFGAGIYQTMTALMRHDKIASVVCPPNPVPTRNETVERFVSWAKRNPQQLPQPAAETVARFFMSEFPCQPR